MATVRGALVMESICPRVEPTRKVRSADDRRSRDAGTLRPVSPAPERRAGTRRARTAPNPFAPGRGCNVPPMARPALTLVLALTIVALTSASSAQLSAGAPFVATAPAASRPRYDAPAWVRERRHAATRRSRELLYETPMFGWPRPTDRGLTPAEVVAFSLRRVEDLEHFAALQEGAAREPRRGRAGIRPRGVGRRGGRLRAGEPPGVGRQPRAGLRALPPRLGAGPRGRARRRPRALRPGARVGGCAPRRARRRQPRRGRAAGAGGPRGMRQAPSAPANPHPR